VIEILLQAERTLAAGRLDEAERLYRQASDADPRNSIAVVGLARVALERGDETGAYRLAGRALGIDPTNVAAQRLSQRLEEIYAYRGESIQALARESEATPEVEPITPVTPVAPAATATPVPEPEPAPAAPSATSATSVPAAPPRPPSLVDRLLRRSRP
jgi:tetratricopeptide (TPR) repeat protein